MQKARSRSFRSPRSSIRVSCQVVRERDFKLVSTSLMNLSETGMLVDARVPVRSGERILVTFYSSLIRSWIDAEGVVTRVADGPRWMGRKQAFGVAFDNLDSAVRKNIRRCLGA